MKQRLLVFSLLVVFGLVMTLATPAMADNLYGSIRGTVTDPSGAVVPGVKVTATNSATGISTIVTTNKDGAYTFLQLQIGDYQITAEQADYRKFQESHIHLDLDQVYNLNISLTVGAAAQVITVEANPVQVQQTDMQLGTTVQSQQIVDIPLNGRNWTQLELLQPGVVGASDRFGGGAYSGNGAETQQNSFLINGVDSNDAALNTPLVVPSPDAIGEFRMVANTLNPEFGRNSGTVINAAIKNGTNQFHGSGFEFYRDTFLDAKGYFELAATPFHQNEFGGTVGGPILKDKAFFFFSFQGTRATSPEGAAQGVPVYTPDEYNNGNFAGTTFTGSSAFPLYGDSASPCPVGGTQCPEGTAYSSLFSTGVIPTVDYNSLAVKLVTQFPDTISPTGLVSVAPIETVKNYQYLGRLDYKITNNDSVWFYGFWQTNPETLTLPFSGTNLPGEPQQQQAHTQQYSFSWSHTFSPTTLNEFRLGYSRLNFAAVEPVNLINPTTYGFTGINPQSTSIGTLPVMTVGGLFTLGFSSNGPQPRVQNTDQVTDNFSKVWGHHTFKAGVNFDRPQVNNPFYNSPSGNFNFNGTGTFSTGDPGVDFLLGLPSTYTQGSGSVVHASAHEIYAYVQDQWQVRPNLTITYGTGYDVETPWRNTYGKGLIMGAFRPGQQSTVFPTAPPGFVYPGDAGINKYGGQSIHYDDFAPRVGFAWSPTDSHNWSVHGGVGLYYNRSEEELALQTLTNAPFAITSAGANPVCGSIGFANPFASTDGKCTTPQLFPFTPYPAGDTNIDFSQFAPVGYGFNTESPNFTAPRSVNFNLTIERQLDKATILSAAYVGNRGRHEEGAIDLNLAGQAPGVNPVAAAAGCPNGFAMTGAPCPVTPITENPNLTWTNGTPVAGATPFNAGVYGQPGEQVTAFNSHYDSLQVTLNRRFSKGLQVLAAYTWSRYFDQTSSLENGAFNFPGINPYCSGCMWGPSSNDAPQRFVVSYTYTLPIYSLTHKWKRVTDDWNVSGIYTLQHGTPVAVFNFLSTSLTCDVGVAFYACPDRADATGAPIGIRDPRNKNGSNPQNLYFNPAAFTVPNPGTLGTASRNPLYGPGINYGDIAIEKSIHIDETRYFQLRLETFNTFNHTNFANPSDPALGLATANEDVSQILGNFGEVYTTRGISTNGEGRAVQLAGKFYF